MAITEIRNTHTIWNELLASYNFQSKTSSHPYWLLVHITAPRLQVKRRLFWTTTEYTQELIAVLKAAPWWVVDNDRLELVVSDAAYKEQLRALLKEFDIKTGSQVPIVFVY